jgi:hypothetical protein
MSVQRVFCGVCSRAYNKDLPCCLVLDVVEHTIRTCRAAFLGPYTTVLVLYYTCMY